MRPRAVNSIRSVQTLNSSTRDRAKRHSPTKEQRLARLRAALGALTRFLQAPVSTSRGWDETRMPVASNVRGEVMADRPVQFGPKAAKQIIDTVIRVNRQPYPSTQQEKSRYPRISGQSSVVTDGIVVTPITTFNTNSNVYGSGTVQPVIPTNVNGAFTAVNSGSPVACYNWSVNVSVNTNTHVQMAQVQTANSTSIYMLDWKDC